jgi:hypothetical protein
MPQPSSSNEASAPVWLTEQVYQPKRQRTVDLVRQSIDALREAQARVSLASIAARSREFDPDGVGISESAILTNEEARAYYEQHRSWKHQRRPPTSTQKPKIRPEPGSMKLARDEVRARQRYQRLSKKELIDRLLAAERSSAEWEQRFLAHQDDILSWRLRAEAAEKRL